MGEKVEVKYKFARELLEWMKTGTLPESANQDVRYFLELQWKRLSKRGLQMEYELERPKDDKEFMMGGFYGKASMKSKKYEAYIDYRSYMKTVRFYRNGKKCYTKKSPETLYVTNMWLRDKDVSENETYCCPNCGAISTIKELQEGCPYCMTKFLMSDLFPKATGFFFIKDFSEAGFLEKKVKTFAWGGAIIAMLISLLANLENGIFGAVAGMLPAALIGAFMGYFVWAIGKLASLFTAAIGSVPGLVGENGTKQKLIALLGGFDPSFSYDFFTNQLVSALKMILFSDDRRNLVLYEGTELHPEFDGIVDASFGGVINLKNYQARDGYCTLNLDVHMVCVHDNGRSLSQKKNIFNMTIVKNVTHMEELGFSIKKVKCQGCGGSFDATKEKHCPYCGTSYDMREDEWVVTDIRQVK